MSAVSAVGRHGAIGLSFRLCVAVIVVFSSACTTTRPPVPPGEVPQAAPLSQREYQAGEQVRSALRRHFHESRDVDDWRRVRRVSENLLAPVDAPQAWQITVFEGDNIENAAATQGKQVFVWSGMLRAVRNDAELAAVLAHEIAHVLADHVTPTSGETVNRLAASAAGLAAGSVAARQGAAPLLARLLGGLTQQTVEGIVVNPYTQRMELEADTIGLFLMADAGYDPYAAVSFWERSAEPAGTLEHFFSTHPPSEERLTRLHRYLPEAEYRFQYGL